MVLAYSSYRLERRRFERAAVEGPQCKVMDYSFQISFGKVKGLILAVLQGVGSKWSLKLVSHALQSLRRLSLGSLHHKWKKKGEKLFQHLYLNKEKQTGRYLNYSFYFSCWLNCCSSKFKFWDCFFTFFWLFFWSSLKLLFKIRQTGTNVL